MSKTLKATTLSVTDKIALVDNLREYDHAFLDEQGVRRFLDPFGITGGVSTLEADGDRNPKGLTLNNGATSARGQDAAVIAEMIAASLGCPDNGMMGRGSRLRRSCDLAIEKLKSL